MQKKQNDDKKHMPVKYKSSWITKKEERKKGRIKIILKNNTSLDVIEIPLYYTLFAFY